MEGGGALGGLEGQVGVGALEKVKKGKGHRGKTSRSKEVVLGNLYFQSIRTLPFQKQRIRLAMRRVLVEYQARTQEM